MNLQSIASERQPRLTHRPFAWRTIIELREQNETPLYRQISTAIQDAVRANQLRSGMRLPSERDFARELGVSRTTIVAAYQDLESCGFIRRQVGRGSFLCAHEPAANAPFVWEGKLSTRCTEANGGTLARFADPHRHLARGAARPSMISFAPALPATEVFPRDELREVMDSAVFRNLPSVLGFGAPHGQLRLREVIADRMNVPLERVLIVSGAQEAFHLIGRCLTDRKDTVVAEDPGSTGFRSALSGLGCTTLPWQAPAWDIDALEDTIVRYSPRVIYTNGIFQNPTTRSMSRETRHHLVELSSRYRVPIVEDIAFIDLAFRPTPIRTLGQIAPAVVIQVGSFSPTLGPGLRLGFVIAPPVLVNQLALEKERTSSFTSSIGQSVVAEMMRSGSYDRHLDRLRGEHTSRLNRALAAIRGRLTPGDVRFTVPEGGSFLWIRLAQGISAETLRRSARELGVDFTPGAAFSHSSDDLSYLRLCFSGISVEQIDEGVRRLALALGRNTRSHEPELAVASSA